MSELEKFATRRGTDDAYLRRWLIEAMVLGAVSDGEFTPAESERVIRVIGDNATFIDMGADELRASLEGVFDSIVRDGFDVRLAALAAALPGYNERVMAFRCVVRVAFADGRLADDEFAFMRRMQKVLGIVDGDVARAFDAAQESDFGGLAEAEPIEAYLDCLLMAAAADRELHDEELATIIGFVLTRPELSGLDEDHLNRYIQDRLRRFAAGGTARRLEELVDELVDDVQRENAYGLAVALCLADGDLAPEEQAFLSALRQTLDIDDARADHVVHNLLRGG